MRRNSSLQCARAHGGGSTCFADRSSHCRSHLTTRLVGCAPPTHHFWKTGAAMPSLHVVRRALLPLVAFAPLGAQVKVEH